ncbi:hypothetical protein Adt_40331 [Abeliophyllum distichum]|uniref:Retrotransposon gag domain-containing protein n=1 Tax=Abeliophyllum distichum TaxID=126358 RepID=A0ABD1Q7S3_9LAMI
MNNWWKPKQSATPLHHHHGGLLEAFHTLQSHVSSFFQKPKNLFVNCCPTAQALYAFKKELYPEHLVYDTRMNLRDLKHNGTIKDYVVEFTTLMLQIPRLSDDDLLKLAYELQHWAKQEFNFFNRNGRNNLAMSDEEIVKKFCKVPVYNIKFSDEEVAQMASHIDKRKSILVYFLSKADAMAYAKHGLIVSVPSRLPYVYSEDLEIVRKKASLPHEYFSGVPVFESKNLSICQDYLRLTNEGCLNQRRPVFFKKEDLEKSLAKARAESHDGRSNIIDSVTQIEVASLEDIVQAMKDSSTSEWNNVYFAHPGQDIETNPSTRSYEDILRDMGKY